jgi:hypothetical protein
MRTRAFGEHAHLRVRDARHLGIPDDSRALPFAAREWKAI